MPWECSHFEMPPPPIPHEKASGFVVPRYCVGFPRDIQRALHPFAGKHNFLCCATSFLNYNSPPKNYVKSRGDWGISYCFLMRVVTTLLKILLRKNYYIKLKTCIFNTKRILLNCTLLKNTLNSTLGKKKTVKQPILEPTISNLINALFRHVI